MFQRQECVHMGSVQSVRDNDVAKVVKKKKGRRKGDKQN